MAIEYRLFVDESGDHTYRQLDDLSRRYLGLSGLLIRKSVYDPAIPLALEGLKKRFFRYDADNPPVLDRRSLIDRKSSFGVLRDSDLNAAWTEELLRLYRDLRAQVFTVVIDKREHQERYPADAWNPYSYSLAVLLNRVAGWLRGQATADIMPESRGTNEDNQLLASYVELRANGSYLAPADRYRTSFPEERLLFRKKEHNVAGLQLVDLIAAEQKLLTIEEANRPLPRPIGPFGTALNEAIAGKVNRYGRYFLV